MKNIVELATRQVLADSGWQCGTTLENRVALRLRRFGWKPEDVVQQHRVGRYRLDFAWVGLKVALEADGWMHRSSEVAAKDARRDSWLRSQGWLVFRVDDTSDEQLAEQLGRISRYIRVEIPWDRGRGRH